MPFKLWTLRLTFLPLVWISLTTGCGSSTDRGTIDGGGGGGFRGRPLEDYIQHANELPEYKEYVLPILNSIGRIQPEYQKLFVHIVQDRKWLFLNAPIPQISAERQGSPVNLDQWAIQDSKEIWFSDEYKGPEKQRAQMLLHEILVGLKILRFLSYREYCNVIAPEKSLCEGSANHALIANYKLTALEHKEARAMGDWLFENHTTMTPEEFGQQMHFHQFHGPHYGWKPLTSRAISEQRQMNADIERLQNTTVGLYAAFGVTDHIATQKCELEFGPINDKKLPVVVKFTDLKSKREIRKTEFELAYDPSVPLNVGQVASALDRYFPVRLTEGKSMTTVGDRQKFLDLHFERNYVLRAFGGIDQVNKIENGVTSSSGSNDGPFGVDCEKQPVRLPLNYGLWLEMREGDREFLERKYYGGKSLKELISELTKRPDLNWNN